MEELNEKNVDDSHINYINFEFIENEELQDYKKLNKYIKDQIKDNEIYYVFLDEVQNVDNFEKVVSSLRALLKNISIFIQVQIVNYYLKKFPLFSLEYMCLLILIL